MSEAEQKEAARARISILIRNFKAHEAEYLRPTYNETQARTDFITPLLEAFGWDVHNAAAQPLGLREVIEEATVEVADEPLSKKPDYELRLARQRKLFVEAKKPSVNIETSRPPAFQTRRYGYSASLPISVLTNFYRLAVYDCQPGPSMQDEAHVARTHIFRYEEFETRFDELWSLISRHVVYTGEFDRRFAVDVTRRGANQFDDFFLRQVRSWRERLAVDIHVNTPNLTPVELTYAVQLFLSRIVFLRICEDREIERYETLRKLPNANTFDALVVQLRRADAFYDSGLFRLIDDERLGIRISDHVLHDIIEELYYPQSPYTFAVVETEVLGEIYEQFLGEVISVEGPGVRIVSKPEIRESGGVVPTPRFIVDAIVARTLMPSIAGKSPTDLSEFSVADLCCGSGVFLLSTYEFLLEYHLSWYLNNEREKQVGITIYDSGAGQWRLTFEEKRRILLAHIRGVDIDSNAVEVARFSLLLKLIENETAAGLREFVARAGTPALPPLEALVRSGNSLVSAGEWATALAAMTPALIERVNPLDWPVEFPAEMARGGFDVIVGNPPYTRIQNMQAYMPEELTYYQAARSPYLTARQDNFDKYALFIERSLHLLREDGRLGYIVPHKFMITQAGRALRRLLTVGHLLEEIVHFGVKQVFGQNVSNYTCILVADKRGNEQIRVERVRALDPWRYGDPGEIEVIPATALGEERWEFGDADTRALFARIRAEHPAHLGQVAEIFVGLQTSDDDVYIFRAQSESATHVTFRWNDSTWTIEKEILRPCLYDSELPPFGRPNATHWMIFPYELTAGPRGTVARLIQPDVLARDFPGAIAYLAARRAELEDRNISGGPAGARQFYQFGRSQSLTKFDSPKIILPALSLESRYSYDDRNIVVTGGGNGPYYLLRARPNSGVSDRYLLAVLNHPLSEAFVRNNTSSFRGGYYSHGKQFISPLPIPIPTEADRATIEGLVTGIISAQDAFSAARTPAEQEARLRVVNEVRRQVENEVSRLFGLSESDMEVVRAVPIPA